MASGYIQIMRDRNSQKPINWKTHGERDWQIHLKTYKYLQKNRKGGKTVRQMKRHVRRMGVTRTFFPSNELLSQPTHAISFVDDEETLMPAKSSSCDKMENKQLACCLKNLHYFTLS